MTRARSYRNRLARQLRRSDVAVWHLTPAQHLRGHRAALEDAQLLIGALVDAGLHVTDTGCRVCTPRRRHGGGAFVASLDRLVDNVRAELRSVDRMLEQLDADAREVRADVDMLISGGEF